MTFSSARSRHCSARVALAATLALACLAHAADPRKVLRVATADIETLDPQSYSESPSFDVLRAIYEGLYEVDYLATPPRYTPVTASALPEITDGGKTWVMHVRPGIYFTNDPAFKGRKRELTADDYVYSLKRWLDPNSRRGGSPVIAGLIVGGRELLDEARKTGKFDLDRPMEGLRALDRYTVQLKLTEPNYPVIEPYLTIGAVAREVVEARGGDLRTYAVGTGPFRLKELKRGSRIVLEANPDYRGVAYPDSGNPQDAELVKRMRGAPFPRVGTIELLIIEEDSTRLLEFDRGNIDYVVVRSEIATRALDRDKLRPEYAARGVTWYRVPEPYVASLYFNLDDPVVGGMDAAHVALRRAVELALDRANLIDVVYAGQALPANQLAPPGVAGHDPRLPHAPAADPAAARALLDRYGYKPGSDGLRTARDGSPLTITIMLRSGAVSREVQTLLRKNLMAVGLRTDFHVVPFQDAVKELTMGQYQVWYGGFGGTPTAYAIMSQLYGKTSPQINVSKFSLPEYDAAIERFMRTSDPAEQVAAARRAAEIQRAYVPMIPVLFRLENYFVQPWLTGFRPSRFETYWKYYDIDVAKQPKRKQQQ
jgi:oligopeptide transport system substrate-binding protein